MREWTIEQKARVIAEGSRLIGEQLSIYLAQEEVSAGALFPMVLIGVVDRASDPAMRSHLSRKLTSSRYAHLSPKQLVPRLADEGLYLPSESTLYRLRRRYGLRASKRTVNHINITRAATLHRASGPNQMWSWDITWLPTIVRGIYLHLYLVMGVWSRRIVG